MMPKFSSSPRNTPKVFEDKTCAIINFLLTFLPLFSGLKANFGETEILAPLKAIFALPVIDGYNRQVFVLTDGQVNTFERAYLMYWLVTSSIFHRFPT